MPAQVFTVRSVARAGTAALFATTMLNLLVREVAISAFDVDETVKPMLLGSIIAASLVPVLVGSIVLLSLPRVFTDPLKAFRAIGILAALASLIGPVMVSVGALPDVPYPSTGLVVTLVVMHLVSAGVIVAGLTSRLVKP